MKKDEAVERLAASALTISSLCAAALSEQGLLPPLKAKACANEMMQAAAVQDAYRQHQLGDALPSDFATLLQTLARMIEDKAGR